MKNRLLWLGLTLVTVTAFSKTSTFADDVGHAVAQFKKKDPGIEKFFANSVGYAVFPNVGKAGLFIGGAHGDGLVFEKGKVTGRATLIQATIGFQAGAQEFSEIVFFEDQAALDRFKQSKFSVSAEVSAIASAEGAAKKARYQSDVAVFVLPKQGLMVEATVGGQKFEFEK